jgi:HK97 family phage major capsid protein
VPNVVLERFVAERNELCATIESVLNQVEGRDLTDAETAVLEHTRTRIQELDKQIEPLEEYERVKAQHVSAVAELPHPEPRSMPAADRLPARRMDGGIDSGPRYRSAGGFLVDYLRAAGIMTRGQIDQEALARVTQQRVVADQKTGDIPGLLPTPIVGSVVNLIDANRPFIVSVGGGKAMAGIPGTTFSRPKITQHTTVGPQTGGEKTQLPSQKMIVSPVNFSKSTYGGTVDISRQSIDWSDPSAWDILIQDLANVYAIQTETAASAAFKTAATGTAVPVATNDLKGWVLALYTAAMHSYQAGFLMPDRIWCSLDVWAALGSLVDVARVVLPADSVSGTVETPMDSFDIGASSLASFRGDLLGVPRIVVPTLPPGSCIVGPSALYEVYEEVIGLLSVIEPSILGVQVAYGGYVAWGTLAAGAFVPLTPPAGMPTLDQVSIDAPASDGDTEPESVTSADVTPASSSSGTSTRSSK